MKKLLWAGCCLVLVLQGSAWGDRGPTVAVTDLAGRQVRAPFDPDRIVCLGPGVLRLIVYLQAQSKVVGVEDMEKLHPHGRPYWMAYPELAKRPSCGPGGPASLNKKPDLESVLALKPQVIFVTYMESRLADEVQRTLGVPVVVLSYGESATLDDKVFDSLRLAGTILNRRKRADEVAAFVEALREDIRSRTADDDPRARPLVYVGGISYRGVFGIESTERRYLPFDWVGADNAADRIEARIGSHVMVDKEILLKLNPDIVFLDGGALYLIEQDFRKKPDVYRALQAFSSRRVYLLWPFNWYATNVDTALANAYAVGKILHPEGFADVNPGDKAEEIYQVLFGRAVAAQMTQQYGDLGQIVPFIE